MLTPGSPCSANSKDLNEKYFAARWLACTLPCQRFAAHLAVCCASLGAGVVRYAFTVTDLHHLLLAGLPAHYVKFQFQVSTISDGYDAAEYFTKYPGRFISMHVQGWSATTRKIVPVGQGTLDWNRIFTAAKTGGVKNYFVEMDWPLMKASVPYLHHLQVG